MEELLALWLPIVLSAVLVFVASFVMHMVLSHHKKDVAKLPDEDRFLDLLRSSGAKPGMYMLPYCGDWNELKDPEKKKRYDAGPHGVLSVWSGPPAMGANLAMTFVFYLVVGVFVAYIAIAALDSDATYLQVFRVTGTVAIVAYCFGFVQQDIWYKRPLRNVVLDIMDGVVYGLLTAGVFGWLW